MSMLPSFFYRNGEQEQQQLGRTTSGGGWKFLGLGGNSGGQQQPPRQPISGFHQPPTLTANVSRVLSSNGAGGRQEVLSGSYDSAASLGASFSSLPDTDDFFDAQLDSSIHSRNTNSSLQQLQQLAGAKRKVCLENAIADSFSGNGKLKKPRLDGKQGSGVTFSEPIATSVNPKLVAAVEAESIDRDLYGKDAQKEADEDIQVSPEVLQELQEAIRQIPNEQKVAYLEAVRKCPRLVELESSPARFLRFDDANAAIAARRIVAYWEKRKEIFQERAFLPMVQTGEGALSPQDVEVLNTGFLALLPPDKHGRSVLYSNISRLTIPHDPMARVRVKFYTMHVASESVSCQRQGMVIISAYGDKTRACTFERDATEKAIDLFNSEVIPIRLKAFHLVMLSKRRFTESILKVTLQLLERCGFLRVRTVVHSSKRAKDLLADLQEYGFLKERLPKTPIGGKWTFVDFKHWRDERMRHEEQLLQAGSSDDIGKLLESREHSAEEAFQRLQEDQTRKRAEADAIYSKRKRERKKIEVSVLQDEVKRLTHQQEKLKETGRNLEGRLTKAKKIVADVENGVPVERDDRLLTTTKAATISKTVATEKKADTATPKIPVTTPKRIPPVAAEVPATMLKPAPTPVMGPPQNIPRRPTTFDDVSVAPSVSSIATPSVASAAANRSVQKMQAAPRSILMSPSATPIPAACNISTAGDAASLAESTRSVATKDSSSILAERSQNEAALQKFRQHLERGKGMEFEILSHLQELGGTTFSAMLAAHQQQQIMKQQQHERAQLIMHQHRRRQQAQAVQQQHLVMQQQHLRQAAAAPTLIHQPQHEQLFQRKHQVMQQQQNQALQQQRQALQQRQMAMQSSLRAQQQAMAPPATPTSIEEVIRQRAKLLAQRPDFLAQHPALSRAAALPPNMAPTGLPATGQAPPHGGAPQDGDRPGLLQQLMSFGRGW